MRTTKWLVTLLIVACAHGHSEVERHADSVKRIVTAAAATPVWDWLALLCDTFGPRSGSGALANATDWLLSEVSSLDNVHTEEGALVPQWSRGAESAFIVQPLFDGRPKEIRATALGLSVGTPEGGLVAPLRVAANWTHLDALGAAGDLAGALVLLNPVWKGYGNTVEYRVAGAVRAARWGAAGVLVRSMTPFSPGVAHTGVADPGDSGLTPIPAAAVSPDDADTLARMVARGWPVSIHLQLGAKLLGPPKAGRTVVAELTGTDLRDEVVLISGHFDSWDVGWGALDDGGGVAIGVHALLLLRKLGLRPRRTLRFVAWNGEEFGVGSDAYWAAHASEAANIILAAESDAGAFAPVGIRLSAPVDAHRLARDIGQLITRAGGAGGVSSGGEGTDVNPARGLGVSVASLATDSTRWLRYRGAWDAHGPAGPLFQGDYFTHHHSITNSMSVLDPGQMAASLATWASFAFVLANLTAPLPRGPSATDTQLVAALGSATSNAGPRVCGVLWDEPYAEPKEHSRGGDSVLLHLFVAALFGAVTAVVAQSLHRHGFFTNALSGMHRVLHSRSGLQQNLLEPAAALGDENPAEEEELTM